MIYMSQATKQFSKIKYQITAKIVYLAFLFNKNVEQICY